MKLMLSCSEFVPNLHRLGRRMKMSTFFFLAGGCAEARPSAAVGTSSSLRLGGEVDLGSCGAAAVGGVFARCASLAGGGDEDPLLFDLKDDLRPLGPAASGSGEPKMLEATDGERDDRLGGTILLSL